jgi:hypothetical protein
MKGREDIGRHEPAGIVIHVSAVADKKPAIAAFIWGGKVVPTPTLPYGRWKPKAA